MSKEKEIREAVRTRYGQIVRQDQKGCCPSCGCGPGALAQAQTMGYKKEDLDSIPEEAIMGLGCGNPVALADLKVGEAVLDLGSGTGADVFLAARKVGAEGKAIGIDMTKEMVDKATRIANEHGYQNVEFYLGEMENLPLEDESVDVIISNCVINLCPDKSKVFSEAYRVLKPGGRVVISDIVSEGALPEEIKSDLDAWACCIGGTIEEKEYLEKMKQAGFKDIQVKPAWGFHVEGRTGKLGGKLLSITVKARK